MEDWYKDAVVYEIRVRSFCDSDADGIGDFAGLISKLDYLERLGVTALWLLPFYPSPLKDDGYDIADYRAVHPDCGTLDDFKRFLEVAHARGMHVITELVLNHTSDQHAWFQRARKAPKGSPERGWYLWSETDDRFGGVRIIFPDFEPSNWTWDPVAEQFFFHRFFRTQPDLNYDNPAVQDAVLAVADFWLGMGVDGLRLDAVPYLFKREGTPSESLPETHAFLRKLRAHIDSRHRGKMLLAEANQWPEETARYFGDGDECHMAFNFPLMPRLYLALAQERAEPIAQIVARTLAIGQTGQWAGFLRNHDELTLEMVSDDEREQMWRLYAPEARQRINVGIRRRLAPLLGGDRRKLELLNTLLLCMPGTPVLYYGDEIGMGDDLSLADRNGVRTPMQWNGQRNAGFSDADPQRLTLPVVVSCDYHYQGVNVEAQELRAGSLLHWMRRLLAARNQHAALFGRGTYRPLDGGDPAVLAFGREHGAERALIAANLASAPRWADLPLDGAASLVDLLTGTRLAVPPGDRLRTLLGPYQALVFLVGPS